MNTLSENEWKGHLASIKFDLRAAEKGIVVSVPQIPCRYDRVMDIEGKLLRVQVKYAGQKVSHSTGVTCSKIQQPRDRCGTMRSYGDDEVDAIVLYIPQIDKLCLFGPEDFVGKTVLTVRYEKSKNNQKSNINWFEDYEW